MVTISQAAAKEINRIKSSRQKPDSYLRLQVRSGGCSGLFYELELEENIDKNNSDREYQSNGVSVLIDSKSQSYIKNLQLDYSEDLMGGGFRFRNSQEENICGCGLSFALTPNEK